MRKRATMAAMNLALRKPMSLAEFLEWEDRQELRYEFDGVEPVGHDRRHGWSCHNSGELSDSYWWEGAQGHALPLLRKRSQDPRRRRSHSLPRRNDRLLASRSNRQGRR